MKDFVVTVSHVHCKSGNILKIFRVTELFCSVLSLPSIRRLATPWMNFLHLSLSSAILIDSSKGSPVHFFMLSIHAVCGLPHLCVPRVVPCIISFCRQLPCFLMV